MLDSGRTCMLQGSWTYHHKVAEDGGDQVGGDEGEVRGQELCEPCDGDARGDLGEGEGMSCTYTCTHNVPRYLRMWLVSFMTVYDMNFMMRAHPVFL